MARCIFPDLEKQMWIEISCSFAATAVQSKAGMVCKCFAYKLISHNLLHEEVKYRWLQYHKVQQHTQFPIPFAENIFQSSFSHRISFIEHCERSELRLHFEWTNVNQKCQNWSIWASFWKPEACGQTVLPDRSILIGQKLVCQNSNATFWVIFQQIELG